MRFLWLGTYESDYPRGRVLRDGLAELGHEVVECHAAVWERDRHKAGAFLGAASLAASAARFGGGWARLLAGLRGAGAVDAVVAGYPAQPDMAPAWLAARHLRAPLVADLMVALGDTLAGDRGRASGVAATALTGFDRLAVRLADLVMTDTRANAAWCVAHLGADPRRTVAVPVGAEPLRFPAADPPPGPVQALFVGKLAPLHGLGVVLAAARMPGVPPIHIVGAGQLDGWLRGELARGAPPGLVHTPWVPYERLGAELARSHICLGVFGGSDKAGRVVPNKVWQAMAVGRPIVTADTPGVRKVLTHERDALLVPPGDPRALAAALARLAGDAALRDRLGRAARARYELLGRPARVAAPLVDAVRAITAPANRAAASGA
ncbi:MAG: glycosyltransferase [Thermoleophilia bacterium]